MRNLVLSIFSIFGGLIIQAQQVSNYSIDVHFFPKDAQMWGYPVSDNSFMRGSAKVEFSELNDDTLTFYLHGELKIDSIISTNTVIKYTSEKVFYRGDYSNIGLKTTVNSLDVASEKILHIYYSGFMNPSKARSLSDYMRINKKDGVYLRANYYSPWFPIFLEPDQDDYKVNFKTITVKLPGNFKAVVTGELLNEILDDEHYTAIWKPGTTEMFNIQCSAREYEVIPKENLYVYYVSERENGEKITDFAEKLKNLFISNLRNVQDTSSLYIIEMPEYGNISSQNVIGISTDVYKNFNDDLYSKLTIAHELVHPYVYIPVAKNSTFSALVIEGFPSFFHLYGLKRTLDIEDFDMLEYMTRVEKNYIDKKQSGVDSRGNQLPAEKPILKISFDEIGQYKDVFILSDRVGLFLYQLWTEMGDKNYDQFLKELFQFDSINYKSFESLIVKYIPNYENNLSIWLNTIDYPKSLQIKEL